jgi:phosphopantothenoylcysteine decarboxylase / phosphopantothenate---cysteine ligase
LFKGKHIVLGVTGSIAAYKSALLVREFVKAGAEVRVVMTPSACEFITPLTLGTLSGHDIVVEMFPENAHSTWHIQLGMWADIMLVAPASANTIAKLAHGFADNALASLALAVRCPVIIAPAMDMDMFTHAATQANLEILRSRGVEVIEPESGELASGLTGQGRLPEVQVILDEVGRVLARTKKDFDGIPFLITAGPTYEDIDPVRYIGNRSSGKMGFALAEAAADRGAEVILISGPVHLPTPERVSRIDVRSAREMFEQVAAAAPQARVIIMSAAVADFTPATVSDRKVKKETIAGETLSLQFNRTEDILGYLGTQKREQVLVGFALETHNDIENATRKLRSKNADMIVLNNAATVGAGFETDTNVATLLLADGRTFVLDMMRKTALADIILDHIRLILP